MDLNKLGGQKPSTLQAAGHPAEFQDTELLLHPTKWCKVQVAALYCEVAVSTPACSAHAGVSSSQLCHTRTVQVSACGTLSSSGLVRSHSYALC